MLLELPRYSSILYSRLKYGCSSLNSDLFNSNLVPTPLCSCRTDIEDLFHFLYNCPLYDVIRENLMFELPELGLYYISIPAIFDCDSHITDPAIIYRAQSAIYKFLISTRRF